MSMTSFRLATIALGAALAMAAPGCRTAGVGNMARPDPLPVRTGQTASALLAEHNRNAARVRSVEAKPTITVAVNGSSRGASGKLALERPRNFKLVLSGPIHDVADIGSNEKEFWFWVKDSKERAVYYCDYDESGASPLASSLQPDWIVESLGLREVPADEAAEIRVAPGKDPGTVVLTHRQKTAQGESLIKETILSEATRRVREHRIYSGDRKTMLARASINEYADYPLPAEPGEAPRTVYLPKTLRLEWTQEKLALDVTLGSVKVNTKFDPSRREALFVEPKLRGFARVNLAERAGIASAPAADDRDTPTSVRETMPAPPPRVRLVEPSPIGLDGARRMPRDPAALAADLSPSPRPSRAPGVEELIAPPIPTAADPAPEYTQARSGWRTSLAPALER